MTDPAPAPHESAEPRDESRAEVVVVGLGLSGLVALRELERAGVTAIGLDARDRVGGRTERRVTGSGYVFEGGGEFVKATQSRMRDLMASVGVGSIPLSAHGSSVFVQDGERHVEDAPFDAAPDDRADYLTALASFDALVDTIAVGNPASSPDALDLDATDVVTWVARQTPRPRVRARLERDLVSGLGGRPSHVSLLSVLHYRAAALAPVSDAAGPDVTADAVPGRTADAAPGRTADAVPASTSREARIVGGGNALARAVAGALDPSRLRLSQRVSSILQSSYGVIVSGATGDGTPFTVEAARVIVALSPKLMRSIVFEPALPEARQTLVDGWTQGYGTKTYVVYDSPWWRSLGLSGFASGDLYARSVADVSPDDGSTGVLLAETHPLVTTDQDARGTDQVLADLATYLGSAPTPPLHVGVHAWIDDEFAGGCGSPLPPGLLTSAEGWTVEPFDRISFAGTESAAHGWGSMEGAVRAGQRAAGEVLESVPAVRASNR